MDKTSRTYTIAAGIEARIDRDAATNSATVTIFSKIHKMKEYIMRHSYSCEFTDAAILKDSDFQREISPFLK